MKALLLAVLLVGCGLPAVHDRPASAPAEVLDGGAWCMVVEVAHRDRWVACTETSATCDAYQQAARHRGGLVRVTSVSPCL